MFIGWIYIPPPPLSFMLQYCGVSQIIFTFVRYMFNKGVEQDYYLLAYEDSNDQSRARGSAE